MTKNNLKTCILLDHSVYRPIYIFHNI